MPYRTYGPDVKKLLGNLKGPGKKLAKSSISNDPAQVFEAAFAMVASMAWAAIKLLFLTIRKLFNA